MGRPLDLKGRKKTPEGDKNFDFMEECESLEHFLLLAYAVFAIRQRKDAMWTKYSPVPRCCMLYTLLLKLWKYLHTSPVQVKSPVTTMICTILSHHTYEVLIGHWLDVCTPM